MITPLLLSLALLAIAVVGLLADRVGHTDLADAATFVVVILTGTLVGVLMLW